MLILESMWLIMTNDFVVRLMKSEMAMSTELRWDKCQHRCNAEGC